MKVMKRFKISLAVLAMVFAVGSAFTTKHSLFLSGWYLPDTQLSYPSSYSDTQFTNPALPSGVTPVQNDQTYCDNISNQLCAAHFDGTSSTPNIVEPGGKF
jgi:hypothetical protein